MTTEPATLQIALTAWVLEHAPASQGKHQLPDGCIYVPTQECAFKVAFAPGPSPSDDDFIEAPVINATFPIDPAPPLVPGAMAMIPLAGSLPLIVRITATPTKKVTVVSARVSPEDIRKETPQTATVDGYFGATAYYAYNGAGVWARHARPAEQEEAYSSSHFSPPVALSGTLPVPFSTALISFFLSRVRDCTTQALWVMQEKEEDVQVWIEESADFNRLRTPPVEDGRVVFERTGLDLDNDCRVLEVRGFQAPALVGVCWPRNNSRQTPAVAPAFRAQPMEALLFFHASYNQNLGYYSRHPHPFGYSYINDGLHKYMIAGNPPAKAYPLSLPFQIKAAGKQTVLVLPLNRTERPELANINVPDQAVELLEEIQAAYLRYAGLYYWSPRLGRLAIASFSAGVYELERFRTAAAPHPLLGSLLQEAYLFDPVHSNAPRVSNLANGLKQWAGNVPERRVRVYNNAGGPGHAEFVGMQGPFPASPCFVDSADGRFTAGVITDQEWYLATEGMDRYDTVQRPDLTIAGVARDTEAGAGSVSVDSTAKFRQGDLTIVGKDNCHRVSSIAGRELRLATPLRENAEQGCAVFRVFNVLHQTTLASDAAAGAGEIEVAFVGSIGPDDFIIIADWDHRKVGSVQGNKVRLKRPLSAGFKQGDAVIKWEPLIRTRLAADAQAGETELEVYPGTTSLFKAGDLAGVAMDEIHKIAAVSGGSVTLSEPLERPREKNAAVAKLEEYHHYWGEYHAMFVVACLTDAMRKSGFR